MLTCRAILPDRLGVFVAAAPFAIDEALATQYAIVRGEVPGLWLDTPSILDFTGVTVSDLTAPELLRFVRVRRKLLAEPATGPLAFVCGSSALFGMLRMFAILAEIGGLWQEAMVLVTMDPVHAFGWITERAGLDAEQTVAAAAELARALGWELGNGEAM